VPSRTRPSSCLRGAARVESAMRVWLWSRVAAVRDFCRSSCHTTSPHVPLSSRSCGAPRVGWRCVHRWPRRRASALCAILCRRPRCPIFRAHRCRRPRRPLPVVSVRDCFVVAASHNFPCATCRSRGAVALSDGAACVGVGAKAASRVVPCCEFSTFPTLTFEPHDNSFFFSLWLAELP